MRILNITTESKKLISALTVVFVAGFAIGQMIGRYVVEPSAAIYYQKSLQGLVYVETLPGVDGKCPNQFSEFGLQDDRTGRQGLVTAHQ